MEIVKRRDWRTEIDSPLSSLDIYKKVSAKYSEALIVYPYVQEPGQKFLVSTSLAERYRGRPKAFKSCVAGEGAGEIAW